MSNSSSAMAADTGKPRGERWSKVLVFVCALVAIWAVARNALLARNHALIQASIRCDRPIDDFGEAFSDQVLHRGFEIVNSGGRPLTVAHVQTSCGCTTTARELMGTEIPPGGSAVIPVVVRLEGQAVSLTASSTWSLKARPDIA